MKKLMKKVVGFMKNEEGQGLVEYALILALVALLVIVALKFLGNTVANTYNNIGNAMSGM
jgi:pilus assembly protein Flp/PilA